MTILNSLLKNNNYYFNDSQPNRFQKPVRFYFLEIVVLPLQELLALIAAVTPQQAAGQE